MVQTQPTHNGKHTQKHLQSTDQISSYGSLSPRKCGAFIERIRTVGCLVSGSDGSYVSRQSVITSVWPSFARRRASLEKVHGASPQLGRTVCCHACGRRTEPLLCIIPDHVVKLSILHWRDIEHSHPTPASYSALIKQRCSDSYMHVYSYICSECAVNVFTKIDTIVHLRAKTRRRCKSRDTVHMHFLV